jgi:hypothetical protein
MVALTPFRIPKNTSSVDITIIAGGSFPVTGFSAAVPTRAPVLHHWERGYGADFSEQFQVNPTGYDELVGDLATRATFGIFKLPELSDYTLIGCTSDVSFNTRSRQARGIDCGMETDAFIKRGKTQPGDLSIGGKLKGFAEGLTRFDGLRTTCMLIGVKDGQVTGDRLVFTQWVPNLKARLPEGDGDAMVDAEGKFVEHMFFVAL